MLAPESLEVAGVSRVMKPIMVLGGLGLAAAVILLDWSPAAVLVPAVAAWAVRSSRRFGAPLAAAIVPLTTIAAITALLVLTPAAGIPVHLSVTVGALVAFVGAVLAPSRVAPAAPDRASRIGLLSALAGPLLWSVALIISWTMPIDARVGWVMRNDMANTLVFAGSTVDSHGIPVGGSVNPAPIASALIAAVTPPGDPSITTRLLVVWFLWGVVIAASAFLGGVAAAAVARAVGSGVRMSAVASAGGSLMVVSWLFTGAQIDNGFFSVHVTFVILFATFIAAFAGLDRPGVQLSMLLLAIGTIAMTWSPLLTIPTALTIVAVLAHRRALTELVRSPWTVVALSLSTLAAMGGIAFAGATLLGQRAALSGAGGIGSEGPTVLLVASGVLVTAAPLARGSLRGVRVWLCWSVAGAAALGLAVLLVLNRHLASPWTYYPLKYAWVAGCCVAIVAFGALAAVGTRVRPRALRAAFATALIVASVAIVVWTPQRSGTPLASPLLTVASPAHMQSAPQIAAAVIAAADRDRLTVYWRSSDWANAPWIEGEANVWLIQLWIGNLSTDADLRLLAYSTYHDKSTAGLCSIADLAGGPIVAVTADPILQDELTAACPEADVTVRTDDAAG